MGYSIASYRFIVSKNDKYTRRVHIATSGNRGKVLIFLSDLTNSGLTHEIKFPLPEFMRFLQYAYCIKLSRGATKSKNWDLFYEIDVLSGNVLLWVEDNQNRSIISLTPEDMKCIFMRRNQIYDRVCAQTKGNVLNELKRKYARKRRDLDILHSV